MATETTYICDIKDREHGGVVHLNTSLPVVFITEQTEGRVVSPYIENNTSIDICDSCLSHMIELRTMLEAHGAMGHNTVYFP